MSYISPKKETMNVKEKKVPLRFPFSRFLPDPKCSHPCFQQSLSALSPSSHHPILPPLRCLYLWETWHFLNTNREVEEEWIRGSKQRRLNGRDMERRQGKLLLGCKINEIIKMKENKWWVYWQPWKEKRKVGNVVIISKMKQILRMQNNLLRCPGYGRVGKQMRYTHEF